EAARPMMIGFRSPEAAGSCVAAIIAAGIIPVAIEYMDRAATEVCEAFAGAGYPLDAEALLIVEVEGSENEIGVLLGRIGNCCEVRSENRVDQLERGTKRAHLGRAQGRVRSHWPYFRLSLHGRRHSAQPAAARADAHKPDLRRAWPESCEHLPRRRRQSPPARSLRCQQPR